MSDERRYSDREVRLILRKAVDLQHRSSEATDSSRGMSLEELTQVAAEAGISATHVSRAALEVGTPAGQPSGFFGSPAYVVAERVVDAFVVPESFDGFL